MPLPAAAAGFIAPLALEGVAQAGKALGTVLPTELDRRNKERLAELRRREDLGLLGLTDQQESVIREQAQASRAAAKRANEAEMARGMAASGSGSGQGLNMALAGQQAEMDAAQSLGVDIAQADVAQQQADMDELDALIAASARRQMQRRSAGADVLRGFADVGQEELLYRRETGQGAQGPGATKGAAREHLEERQKREPDPADDVIDSVMPTLTRSQALAAARMTAGSPDVDPETGDWKGVDPRIAEIMVFYGVDKAEAEDAMEYLRENPHLARRD